MRAAATILALVLVACAHVAPPVQDAVVADRLYCGLSIPDGGVVSEPELQQFIDEVVVARFPEGFTVWRAQGVFRGGHEDSIVIEILHPYDARVDATIEAIAGEYRARFHQTSVLRVTLPARMELIE